MHIYATILGPVVGLCSAEREQYEHNNIFKHIAHVGLAFKLYSIQVSRVHEYGNANSTAQMGSPLDLSMWWTLWTDINSPESRLGSTK